MRVYLNPSNYYNFSFDDSKAYQAYTLESPDLDEDERCCAYVERNSRSQAIIRRLFQSAIDEREDDGEAPRLPMKRFTLRLSSTPGNAARRQFAIEKVIATGWVKSAAGDLEDHLEIMDDEPESILAEREFRQKARRILRSRESWRDMLK